MEEAIDIQICGSEIFVGQGDQRDIWWKLMRKIEIGIIYL